MVGVVLLFLGVFLLLTVVGRIWIDRSPVDSRANDSAAADSPSKPITLGQSSQGGESQA
jgi:hypothetical protein